MASERAERSKSGTDCGILEYEKLSQLEVTSKAVRPKSVTIATASGNCGFAVLDAKKVVFFFLPLYLYAK